MKVKLSVQRSTGVVADIVVTADATATVGRTAAAIAAADAYGAGLAPVAGPLTLRMQTPDGRPEQVLQAGAGLVVMSRDVVPPCGGESA